MPEKSESLTIPAQTFWDQLTYPRPFVLGSLIAIGLALEFCIFYFQNVSSAYTHFFYLIIVIAGLWYPKRVIWVAGVFSILYLAGEVFSPVNISPDAIVRAVMFCIVALVVGGITLRVGILQSRVTEQYSLLRQSYAALEQANRKLHMLSSITRHDVLNQLLALNGFLELSREKERDPEILGYMKREADAITTIEKQISFTKYYQDIGIQAPKWQEAEDLIKSSAIELRVMDIVTMDPAVSGLEIYADPLIRKVFFNLMENALRHGDHVSRICFSFTKGEKKGILTCRDDGIGVSQKNKNQIFSRGFGTHTGLGLFLSREILSITDIAIEENGIPGRGARFEISIPEGNFRYRYPHT